MKKIAALALMFLISCVFTVNSFSQERSGPAIKYDVSNPALPELVFTDTAGKAVKEMALNSPEVKKTFSAREITERTAVISKDFSSAALVENFLREPLQENAAVSHLKGIVRFLDVSGKVLWSKETPKGMKVTKMAVSEDGGTVFFLQVSGSGKPDGKEPPEKLKVFDRKGSEVFAFPQEAGAEKLEPDFLAISPDGRYACVRSGGQNVFFDVQDRTSMRSDGNYSVYKLDNNGVAFLGTVSGKDRRHSTTIIDLKNYLK